ncbi:hypothetical protein AAFN86_28220 [Roseomonas sp. CAU 1739]|uniref:hypothetical protein n=1 Tax=Roseomonas sp. CAU 1739 TaxID=3140364 RepID=UPI00325B1940
MLRIPLPRNPADYRETPGVGQTVGGRPVVHLMSVSELVFLEMLTRDAARGCLHENRTALGAQLMRDADWLKQVLGARARHMTEARHG